MAEKPDTEFGARKPVAIRPAQPVKRGQVALLLMGTLAVGGGAYAMMPSENCNNPNRPGIAAPPGQATNTECRPRSSSSSGGSSGGRSGFYSGSSSSSSASGTSSDSGSSHVTRAGFGSIASHFTGGG